jgi:hypothetical protein
MNSYSIGLSGQWWLMCLLIIIASAIAIFTYRHTVPQISKSRKIIQISLRSLALALLLFALFEPVATILSVKSEPPRLAVLLDNSISAGFSEGRSDNKADYETAVKNTNFMSLDADNRKIIRFDAEALELQGFTFDSLRFDGGATDISEAFAFASRIGEDNNIRAALIITDGAYNSGTNPLYKLDELGIPVFVVGIGDTTEDKDISVQSILTNEVAYVDNPVPLSVNVKASGYEGEQIRLGLYDNGEFLSEQLVTISSNNYDAAAIFEYKPKKEGVRKLTVTASSLVGETTLKNNSRSEFINVLQNKRSIVIFAGAPSPDLSFIINSLNKQKGVEIKKIIQKKGAEYIDESPSAADLKDAEVIVLIGFPIASTSQNSIELIRNELEKGKPLLFISSLQTDYSKLKALQDYLPFTVVSSRQQEFLAMLDIKPQAMASPLLRVFGNEKDIEYWNKLPPLYRTETFVQPKPESEVIANMKVNNVPMKEPLILVRSLNNNKSVATLGYGLYRWRLLGYASDLANENPEAIDMLDLFLNNCYRYLSVRQDNRNVRIKTSKKNYIVSETVEILGQIYDNSYNPIDNATVTVSINGGSENREVILASQGNGRYYAQVAGLAEGDYYYSGNAMLNKNKLGSDGGRFSVGDVALEYLNLKMNAPLLRSIAERSGGKFYTPAEAGSFLKDLETKPSFKERPVVAKNELNLWNLPYLLAAAILLFVIEWFMRKRAGMV